MSKKLAAIILFLAFSMPFYCSAASTNQILGCSTDLANVPANPSVSQCVNFSITDDRKNIIMASGYFQNFQSTLYINPPDINYTCDSIDLQASAPNFTYKYSTSNSCFSTYGSGDYAFVILDKNGSDMGSFIAYYDATSSSLYFPLEHSSQRYLNGFTYGEAMIALLLLICMTVYLYDFLIRLFSGIKVAQPLNREIMGNNSPEGKEIDTV